MSNLAPKRRRANTSTRRRGKTKPVLSRSRADRSSPRERNLGAAKIVHPHAWLWEPLEPEATFVLRTMFGAKAVYLDGKIVLCFVAKAEPWRGVLVCTDQGRHDVLTREFPVLKPHAILPKWMYLSEAENDFERVAQRLVALVKGRDSRIGVTTPLKKRKSRSARRERVG